MKFLARFFLNLHQLFFGRSRIENANHRTADTTSMAEEPSDLRSRKNSTAENTFTAVQSNNAKEEIGIISSNADHLPQELAGADSHAPASFHGEEEHQTDAATAASTSSGEHAENRITGVRPAASATVSILENSVSTPRHAAKTGTKSSNTLPSTFSVPAFPPHDVELAATVHRLNETVSDHMRNHVTRQELRRELESLRRLMETKK